MQSDSSHAGPSRRQRFVRQLPKIELHAHLNGSIRLSTLRSLAASRNVNPDHALILSRTPRTLSEAFDVFRVIHSCVTTLTDIERLAFELGEDLEEDGVVYAEIRTTPRPMGAQAVIKEEEELEKYVKAVLTGFERYKMKSEGVNGKVLLRLILSIDRAKHSATQAELIVSLANQFSGQGVVGIDLSGDPTQGSFDTFLPALARARSLGLFVTLHAGEVPNTDSEMKAMLDFHPDRFGHCCFVSPSNLQRLKSSDIPIELCLTSNLLSNSTANLKDHHFGTHYAKQELKGRGTGTICCISTDDSGVFGSTLSNEDGLVMEGFGLNEEELFALARRTSFATFLDKHKSMDQADHESIEARFAEFHSSWNWS